MSVKKRLKKKLGTTRSRHVYTQAHGRQPDLDGWANQNRGWTPQLEGYGNRGSRLTDEEVDWISDR